MRLRTATVVVGTALLAGCTSTISKGRQDDGGLPSGTAGASTTGAATSAGSSGSGGVPTSAASGSTSGGSGGSGTNGSGSSNGGSSTGVSAPSIVDGGYVFCAGSPGTPGWACRPGTYFCEADGGPGDLNGGCVQCLTDADCVNESLPTYDPARRHCDVVSGFRGYQNQCVQCVNDADCAGNPAGPYCELQPQLSGLVENSILTAGYETCGKFELDCRVDAGEACRTENTVCNASTGNCDTRALYCRSNADCVGYLGTYDGATISMPYCTNGECSGCAPDAGFCPSQCVADSQCLDGMTCIDFQCSCSSDDQCGQLWPACVDGGGGVFDGRPVGRCGCDSNAECGDAGLACLPNPAGSVCGVPCMAPGFPACSSAAPGSGFCDPSTGLCAPCTTDAQCQAYGEAEGPHCLAGGVCGCAADSECPAGETCTSAGSCALPDLPCLRDCYTAPTVCSSDYDCSLGVAGTCCDGGLCGACSQPGFCESPLDCANSPLGTRCASREGTSSLPNACYCETGSDCDGGADICVSGVCKPRCTPSVNCPAGLSCDADYSCRARCDHGATCPADAPICDTGNRVGLNGESDVGTLPGAVWCFACTSESDCPRPMACLASAGYTCGTCAQDSDCGSGEACLQGACLSFCDAGPCPVGQVCDSNDAVGYGAGTCLQCLGPWDCPGNEGCNGGTCGSCYGPNENEVYGLYVDQCPPGDVCSNYWAESAPGVCLQNCDVRSCPDGTTCSVFPDLTPDHAYCFGCVQDSDCADAGAGAWCDLSPFPTFTCKVGSRP